MSDQISKPWYVVECSARNCWCRCITTDTESTEMEHCVTHSGCLDAESATHIVACHNACRGLTPEQIEAIPRLVAWYTDSPSAFPDDEEWRKEWLELDRIFRKRVAK